MTKRPAVAFNAMCLAWLAIMCPCAAIAQEQEAAVESEVASDVILLSAAELEQLVTPIAFYPDEVLAVTLPAATYPLDIVQATRFLEKQKSAPDLAPDENWDPSVLALLNYPVVLTMMNDDLDWTTTLGEAVLNQQSDVIDAIQQVRLEAYASGYLKSDEHVTVLIDADTVEISPSDPKVVYVPIYRPPPEVSHPIADPPAATQLPAAEQPAVEQPIAEVPATEPAQPIGAAPTTEVTNTYNNYYPPTYSQPYTPYYNDTATFWTGALMGGLTMGFLMNWDDDDIDIDFDEGDFDDWSPGRGDVNIDGDVNIGNDVNVGNGDSWRQLREQRGGERVSQLPSTRAKNKAAQPASSLQGKAKNARASQGQVKQGQVKQGQVKKKPAQVQKKQARQPQATQSRQPQKKATALGNVERGRDTVRSSQRGASSQQKSLRQPSLQQQRSPSMKPRGQPSFQKQRPGRQSSFGSQASGKRTKQASTRGSSSRGGRRR